MGQQNSSNKQKYRKPLIGQVKLQNSQIFSSLHSLFHPRNFKKTSQRQGLLNMDNKAEEIFRFVTKFDIGVYENYSGYAELYTKQNVKVFGGDFHHGVRNGFGIQYNLQGDVLYEGQFKDNQYCGWGVTPRYEGEFANGMKNGWGVYKQRQSVYGLPGLFYEGYWQNDRFHGVGALNVKAEEMKQFLTENAKIDLEMHELKYVGSWEQGVLSGAGKLVRVGEEYCGEFVNGEYEGEGVLKNVKNEKQVVKKGKFLQGKLVKEDKK